MKKSVRMLSLLVAVCLTVGILAGCGDSGSSGTASTGGTAAEGSSGNYPSNDIGGSITWGAGGVMDSVSRYIAPLAEQELGATIVLQNRTGATGAIAMQYVYEQEANGYNLLFSAENPGLYKVYNTSELDYENFIPIVIMGGNVGAVLVKGDSPIETIDELIDEMKANPGMQMASTGAGGLPEVASALLKVASGVDFIYIPFDGEAAACTNLMGGHVDFTIVSLSSAVELIKSGDLKALAVLSQDRVDVLPDVPAITESLSEYNEYLPWSSFYGVFVKEGTPQDIVDTLTSAFASAAANDEYQAFLNDMGIIPMLMTGDEAKKFALDWRSNTCWMLYDAGILEESPDTVGIERVQ